MFAPTGAPHARVGDDGGMQPNNDLDVEVLVVGAGIVGSAVADALTPRRRVHVVDAGSASLAGSTGHAPGFIGEFGGSLVATELAQLTTAGLEAVAGEDRSVFDRVGCLEVATSPDGARDLADRAARAREQGLEVQELTGDEVAALAPQVVRPDRAVSGILFPRDAVARAWAATHLLQHRATGNGATFAWETRVQSVSGDGSGPFQVQTSAGTVRAGQVVLCTGIWSDLCLDVPHGLPIVPVRHPYVYGPPQGSGPGRQPFVRFPEHHVYARWHGPRWGFGSYDHTPEPVDMRELPTADLDWDGRFDRVVRRGLDLLAEPGLFTPEQRVDGVYAMTPDNLPLVGRLRDRIWMVAAVWVTHSVGAAQLLAAQLDGLPSPVSDPDALDPLRFADVDPARARAQALAHYSDIYERG